MIVTAAIQEDAPLIGLSILSGAHIHLVDATIKELKKSKMKGYKVFVGGIIPADDYQKKLKENGSGRNFFTRGTPLADHHFYFREILILIRSVEIIMSQSIELGDHGWQRSGG